MKPLLIYSLIFFFCISGGYAQRLIFDNIGVRSGLPSTEVYHVFQGPKGYIWIFTEYGIVKYDGAKFNHVCKNIPIEERCVYSVFQKKDGFLYFTNSKGNLYCVKDDRAYRIKGLDEAKKAILKDGLSILDLFVDNNNGLYFSTTYSTYYYPENKYSISGGLKENHIKDKKSRYFAYKKYPKKVMGGYIVDQNLVKYKGYFGKGDGSRVLVRKSGNKFYQVYRSNVVCLSNGKVIDRIDLKMDVISFEADEENHFWVGLLNGGLIELDQELNVVNHYFDRMTVSSIIFDNQCGLWVSTIENGIYHCKNIKMKSYKNVELMNTSISMIKSINGKLFVGTYKGNLFVKEGESFRSIPLKYSLHAITDIEYSSGQYVVGTTRNILLLDKHFKMLNYLPAASFGMSKIDEDRALIIFPTSLGMYHFKSGLCEKHNFDKGKTRGIVKNKQGEYFIISSNGILKMKDFRFELPKALRKLTVDNVTRLKLDPRDNLWICSKGSGLYCWTIDHRLIHYTNLPTNFVSDVGFTRNGFILIATNLGTFANRLKTINDDSWDMIFQEESIRNIVYEDNIFIGTKFGLNSIRTKELERKKQHYFYLKSVSNDGRPISFQENMMVNYNQNNLEFSYDILNYQSINNRVAYQLNGPVRLSETVEGTQVQLQNLSPGEYTLKVKPIMVNIRESDLSITTKIVVRPAFWQTWIFRIVLGVIIFSLIFLVFWLVNYRRNKHLAEVNQIENLLTEYRLTALKSQVNPHFMSNSLVAIQRLILENETDKAHQYIAKFSLLLRSLLEYSSRSSASIRNELNMIELYVELEQLRFNNQFVFEVQIGYDVDLDDTYMPALITQPFVENAIWHGLLPLDGKKEAKLMLSIQTSDNGILISVIDNGVGRGSNEGDNNHREFESRGTSLIIQRLENLNRLYNTTGGRVQYIDLTDENGQSNGTQVNIWLPNEILIQLSDGKDS